MNGQHEVGNGLDQMVATSNMCLLMLQDDIYMLLGETDG